MNKLLQAMMAHADPSQVEGLSRFFKTGPGQYGEGDKFLGIKVPVTREVVKDCWKETTFADLEDCIRSEYHEVRLAALLALVEIFKHAKRPPIRSGVTGMTKRSGVTVVTERSGVTESSCPAPTGHLLQQQCVEFYLSHTDFINNWDLVDLSCYPLLGVWLLDKDRTLLYDLARNGKTLWEQRIGIVSTMTFIRHGQLSDTFAIADILLHHPHDLIHKAVGWLLREAGKKDKAALEAYLLETPDQVGGDGTNGMVGGDDGVVWGDGVVMPDPDRASPRYQTMPRTMLRYAIEKFPEAERQAYLTGHAH